MIRGQDDCQVTYNIVFKQEAMMGIGVYPNIQQMSAAAADLVRSALLAAAGQVPEVSVALPGGSTPRQMLEDLAAGDGIPWHRITLFPVDEHLRTRSTELENGARIDHLFAPLGARVLTLLQPGSQPRDYRAAGKEADARLGSSPWPPAIACLGMGEDGHVASLLPGPDFERAMSPDNDRRFLGLRPDPLPASAPFDRITMSAAALWSAGLLLVLISGPEKRHVLEQSLAEARAGEAATPIGRLVIGARSPVKILWCP